MTALPPTPFTDSNAVGMTQARAAELGIQTISDLKSKAPSLTLSGSTECRRRLDCKLGLERLYGLKFKKYLSTELPDRHSVLTSGKADVSIVFSTDGQITTEDLLVLEDDKKLFPPYNVSLVVNDKARRRRGRTCRRSSPRSSRTSRPRSCRSSTRASTSTRSSPPRSPAPTCEQFGYTE